MHFLDLDLDFFLNDIAYFKASDVTRLSSGEYQPWTASAVCCFLESRCGLSFAAPLKGRIVKHHDGAFDFWRELIESYKLLTPFDITHIDGHSDLGLGDSGYCYLMSELLHYEPQQRLLALDRSRVEFGNYLAFAVACRWIASVRWVRHPDKSDDLLDWHFKDYNTKSGAIQLKKVGQHTFDDPSAVSFNIRPTVLAFEPEVPFEMLSWKNLSTSKPFDYIVLSMSPEYTPRESDQLIPIIAQYISQI